MLLLLTMAAGLLGAPVPPPFTLADALADARRMSPLREAPARLASAAEEARRRAGRPLNPQVDVRVENFGPGAAGLTKDVFAVVNQTVELGGKRGLRRDLAGAERDVAVALAAGTDWALAGRVAAAYLDTLRAHRRAEVLTASRADLLAVVDVMASRLQEGTVPEADVLKVRADVARLDLDLVRARLDEEQRAIDLAYLVGAPGRLDPARFVEPEVTAPDERDDRALAAQLIRHPEARTSLARVARARQAFAVERARPTPDALVTGGFKRTAGFDTAVAGVAVTLPIFDRNGVATARADGEARAAEAEHAALLRRLTAEAQAASHAARALTARAASVTRDLVAPADAVRLSAAAALREGAVDVLRLLDAERVLRDARHLAIDARLDGVAAAIAARLAAGEEALP